MTEYLKMVPLPSWWQKLELKDLSISELFEELLSWNLESKLIILKYITSTYFGAIVAIFILWIKSWPLNLAPATYICLFHPCCCCSRITNFISTSNVYYSLICQGRQVLFTFFKKNWQKYFRIGLQIGSNFFGRGKKMHLKNIIFANFHTFSKNTFLHHLQLLFSLSFILLGDFCLPFS